MTDIIVKNIVDSYRRIMKVRSDATDYEAVEDYYEMFVAVEPYFKKYLKRSCEALKEEHPEINKVYMATFAKYGSLRKIYNSRWMLDDKEKCITDKFIRDNYELAIEILKDEESPWILE